jgi:hypothetical protein
MVLRVRSDVTKEIEILVLRHGHAFFVLEHATPGVHIPPMCRGWRDGWSRGSWADDVPTCADWGRSRSWCARYR